jgi:hypothetical protein
MASSKKQQLADCRASLAVLPKKGLTVDGRVYIQLALSDTNQQESPFSISKGVISSSRLKQIRLTSAGANPRDSSGPCFDESTGELIGLKCWVREYSYYQHGEGYWSSDI